MKKNLRKQDEAVCPVLSNPEKGDQLPGQIDCRPGDLLWARMSGYPFWPCMVVEDPQKNEYVLTKDSGRSSKHHLHVQFFGDNGSHSWVAANQVIEFEGKEKFLLFAESKKKDGRYASAFPRKGKSWKWEQAVFEAESVTEGNRQNRICYFRENYPMSVGVLKDKEKKPKRNTDTLKKKNCESKENTSSKKTAINKEEVGLVPESATGNKEDNISEEVSGKLEEVGLVAESATVNKEGNTSEEVSGNSAKRLRKMNIMSENGNSNSKSKSVKRAKIRKREKKFPGKFEVFVDRTADIFALQNPEYKDDRPKLMRFLKAMWSDMSDDEKSRYCETYQEKLAALMGLSDPSLIDF